MKNTSSAATTVINGLRTHIQLLSEANPGIWQRVDEIRSHPDHRKRSRSWCFLPQSEIELIACQYSGIAARIASFEGLAAWRPTQSLYVFDQTIVDALSETSVDDTLPIDILFRMPEWCIYLTTTNWQIASWGLRGCFAFLAYDDTQQRSALKFLLDVAGSEHLLTTFPVCLGVEGLRAGIEQASKDAREIFSVAGRHAQRAELESLDISECIRIIGPLVNLVLYLCSANPELEDLSRSKLKPEHAKLQKTRKGLRLFPPPQPTFWEVGMRTGELLRRSYTFKGPTGTVRPHLRRAHWHAFWSGSPKEPAQRVRNIKWLAPILVNDDGAEVIPTVREVARMPKST